MQLGFLEELDKGVFFVEREKKRRREDVSLGLLASIIRRRRLEDLTLASLVERLELFNCSSELSHRVMYWDKVREAFAQATFARLTWTEAVLQARNAAAGNLEECIATQATVELCDVSDQGLSALLSTLPSSFSSDRNLGMHRAPRIDNSDPYKVALTINGRIVKSVIVDTGCEMVVAGRRAARQMGIRPSMMRQGAVVLRCADERVTKAFDRTIDPVPFVFNPGTADETTVLAHVVVTHSEAETVLLGMSVIGKIGLVPNAYKGTLKYYVDWASRGSRTARLACSFNVDFGKEATKASSHTSEVLEAFSALVLPVTRVPNSPLEVQTSRSLYQTFNRQLADFLHSSLFSSLPTLKEAEPDAPSITLEDYKHLTPLNLDLVDISEAAKNPGLVVVELCGGILAATEALVRSGVKIRALHVCEVDYQARLVGSRRLEVLHELFPELLPRKAFERCFATLPQNIRMITASQIDRLGRVDLIICGFPCQGFSRAARTPLGLRDPRTALFLVMMNVIRQITVAHGNCGWVVENVDASDHKDPLGRREFNEVVKGLLGEGFAFDAVAVGSYAHRFRRFWTNLIPSSLFLDLVEKRFALRSQVQPVQNILEPGHLAQLAKHSHAPGPHSVNVVGEPLRAFSTFVTFANSDAYRSQQHSLVGVGSSLEPPSVPERERAMGFIEGMSQCPATPLTDSVRVRLLGGSMDLFQLTFLFQSVLAFQNRVLTN